MTEEERKARYEQAKARRRKRWADIEARRPPLEVALYGLGSLLGFIVFVIWSMIAPSVFSNVATAACIIVWAGAVAVSWRWEDTA